MPMLDAFKTDMFNTVSLVNAINTLPFKPSRIGQMGIFVPRGIPTTTAILESRDGLLNLIPNTSRGGPGTLAQGPKRQIRSFVMPHKKIDDSISADDVQNLRAMGSESELEALATVVNDRLQQHVDSMTVTHEQMMAGCLSGVIVDSDGSTLIFNLFTEFGITETVVDFLLGTSTTDVRTKCLETKRAVEDALGGGSMDHVHVLCSDTFFDALISHADVKAAYEHFQDGAVLRSDPRAGFAFGSLIFENYRNTVGAVTFITEGDGRAFPVGAPALFQMAYAPADYIETVNTIGRPFYTKQVTNKFETAVDLQSQTNPLPLCTRPAVLVRVHSSD